MLTLCATAFIMLVAGYDSTGQTLAYAGYVLATRQDIQDKLLQEIDRVMDDNDGKMPSYADIHEMEYLDMVLHEVLRRYCPVALVQRVCTQDYDLPGYPDLKIKKGQEVHCNAAGIQMDPKYFPEPEKIIPERFSKEEKSNRHP
jgi:cytochrome P450